MNKTSYKRVVGTFAAVVRLLTLPAALAGATPTSRRGTRAITTTTMPRRIWRSATRWAGAMAQMLRGTNNATGRILAAPAPGRG